MLPAMVVVDRHFVPRFAPRHRINFPALVTESHSSRRRATCHRTARTQLAEWSLETPGVKTTRPRNRTAQPERQE